MNFNKKNYWWLLFFVIFFVLHSNHVMDSDEGVLLEGAWHIINGGKLYSDFFAIVTPGTYYILAAIWLIFGVSYWSANTLAIIALFLTIIGVYKISRMLGGSHFYLPLIFIALSSLPWPLITHHIFSSLFLVWALYYFLKFINNTQSSYLISAGLLSALTTLFLQTKGTILIFSLATYLLYFWLIKKDHSYRRPLIYYLVSSILPLGLLFIFWPIKTLYFHLFDFPVFHYSEIIKTPLYLWWSFLVIWAIVVIFLAWPAKSKKIWLLLYLQLILLIGSLSLPDWFHIFLAIFPLCALMPLFWTKISTLNKIPKISYGIGLLAVVLMMCYPAWSYLWQTPFRSVSNHPLWQQIDQNCQDDKNLYAGAFIPGVYFESRSLKVTPYSWLITNHHTGEQFAMAAQALADSQATCAVLSPLFVGKYGYNSDNAVDNYIRQNYRVIWTDKNFHLFKLKSRL